MRQLVLAWLGLCASASSAQEEQKCATLPQFALAEASFREIPRDHVLRVVFTHTAYLDSGTLTSNCVWLHNSAGHDLLRFVRTSADHQLAVQEEAAGYLDDWGYYCTRAPEDATWHGARETSRPVALRM